MKILDKITSAFFTLTLLITSSIWAADVMTVGVVDAGKIANIFKLHYIQEFRENPSVKQSLEKMQRLRGEAQKYQANLKNNTKQHNEDKHLELQHKIQQTVRELTKQKNLIQNIVKNIKRDMNDNLHNKISRAAQQIAKQRGLNIVLPKNGVFFAQDSIDITDDVIKMLKKEFDTGDITAGVSKTWVKQFVMT